MRAILLAAVLGLAVGLFSLGNSSGMGAGDQLPCTVIVQPGESIQAAIDAAEEGAVICLAEGTWEENLVIRKGLTLRGLGPEKSVIKGVKEGEPVILISSNAEIEVIVEGLTLAEAEGGWRRCAEEPLRCPNGLSLGGRVKATIRGNTISGNSVGIFMDSPQANISGNTISGNADGIYIAWGQANISGNTISGNGGNGICIVWAQANISGNTISGNGENGICMRHSAQADISGNTISGNGGGIYMFESAQANISGNIISENTASCLCNGISIYDWAQATISGNTISGNCNGIAIWDDTNADIEGNIISGNGWNGIYISSTAFIQGNKIVNNAHYGVSVYDYRCGVRDALFSGKVCGGRNEISGNKEGEFCPDLSFLMREAGGCFYVW